MAGGCGGAAVGIETRDLSRCGNKVDATKAHLVFMTIAEIKKFLEGKEKT